MWGLSDFRKLWGLSGLGGPDFLDAHTNGMLTLEIMAKHMGGCQNYGPFLGPYYNTAPCPPLGMVVGTATRAVTSINAGLQLQFMAKANLRVFDFWIGFSSSGSLAQERSGLEILNETSPQGLRTWKRV